MFRFTHCNASQFDPASHSSAEFFPDPLSQGRQATKIIQAGVIRTTDDARFLEKARGLFGEPTDGFAAGKRIFHKAMGKRCEFSNKSVAFVTLADSARENAEYAKKNLGTDSLKELRAIPADKLLAEVSSLRRGGKGLA